MKKISVFLAVAFLLSQFNLQAQNKDTTEKEGYIFTDVDVCLQLR